MGWQSDIYSHTFSDAQEPNLVHFLPACTRYPESHINVVSFPSALLKILWFGQNVSGCKLGFIRCCLRKNTYGSSIKH